MRGRIASRRRRRRASSIARCSPRSECVKLSSILSKIALRAVMIRSGSLAMSVSQSAASYSGFQSRLLDGKLCTLNPYLFSGYSQSANKRHRIKRSKALRSAAFGPIDFKEISVIDRVFRATFLLLTFGSRRETTWEHNLFRNRTSSQQRRGHRIALTRTACIAKTCGKRKKD